MSNNISDMVKKFVEGSSGYFVCYFASDDDCNVLNG